MYDAVGFNQKRKLPNEEDLNTFDVIYFHYNIKMTYSRGDVYNVVENASVR